MPRSWPEGAPAAMAGHPTRLCLEDILNSTVCRFVRILLHGSFSICPGQTPHRMALETGLRECCALLVGKCKELVVELKTLPETRSQEGEPQGHTHKGNRPPPHQADQSAASVPLTDWAGCCGGGVSGLAGPPGLGGGT